MTILEFIEEYGKDIRPAEEIFRQWALEEKIDDFLGTQVMGGVIIADLWKDGQLIDSVPEEVRAGFEVLMKEKADTIHEIKALLLQNAKEGEKNLEGLLNKIQGQIGENLFKESVKGATLAPKLNQRGFDIRIEKDGTYDYVQVKVYRDENAAIKNLKELQEDLANGLIIDEETQYVVKRIDFAVNKDIYENVRQKAEELGFDGKIRNLNATRDEIRGYLEEAVENAEHPIENFFGELLGGVCKGVALHAAINGFLIWKGAKEKEQALEDTIYSSVISGGGFAAAAAAEGLLGRALINAGLEGSAEFLTSTVGGGIILAPIALYAREILKRLGDRKNVAERLSSGNRKLHGLIEEFA